MKERAKAKHLEIPFHLMMLLRQVTIITIAHPVMEEEAHPEYHLHNDFPHLLWVQIKD